MNDHAMVLISVSELKEIIREILLGVIKEVPYPSRVPQDDKPLTRAEAAEFLNITPTTLTKYVKEGRVKAGGTERKYSFRKNDLIKFMFSR